MQLLGCLFWSGVALVHVSFTFYGAFPGVYACKCKPWTSSAEKIEIAMAVVYIAEEWNSNGSTAILRCVWVVSMPLLVSN